MFGLCLTVQIVYGAFLALGHGQAIYVPILSAPKRQLNHPGDCRCKRWSQLLFQHRDFFNLFHRLLALGLGLAGVGLFVWGRGISNASLAARHSLYIFSELC